MTRILLIAFFCFTNFKNSFGQLSKMDELGQKMFFNIFLFKPDTLVYDFVKEHFPKFTEPNAKPEWTISPPGPDTFPAPIKTTYSLSFKSHPYFKASFTEGRLDLLAEEAKGYQPRISDYHLWFMFDTKLDAEKAFKVLSGMFEPISLSKKLWSDNNLKVAEYSDKKEFDPFSAVEFILAKDELYPGHYKMFFRIGAYTYNH